MLEEGSIKIWPFGFDSFSYLSTYTFLHLHLPRISFQKQVQCPSTFNNHSMKKDMEEENKAMYQHWFLGHSCSFKLLRLYKKYYPILPHQTVCFTLQVFCMTLLQLTGWKMDSTLQASKYCYKFQVPSEWRLKNKSFRCHLIVGALEYLPVQLQVVIVGC